MARDLLRKLRLGQRPGADKSPSTGSTTTTCLIMKRTALTMKSVTPVEDHYFWYCRMLILRKLSGGRAGVLFSTMQSLGF